MAAYTQFGYGGYPSASQLLSTNVAQSPQTGDTPTAQSTISSANAPALSPAGGECRTANTTSGVADVSTGALSPDALSQNSNTAGAGSAAAASTGAVGSGSIGITATVPPMNNTSGGGSIDASTLGNHVSASGGSSCCENGRPIMTDPVSGQTVCSCQYDSARLALSSYSRLPAASVGVYGTPYPSTDQNPYQSIGVDSSAFYSPLSNPYALKDSATGTEMTAWTSAGLQPTTGYYSYDPMSAYGYGASYDLAARRKNATRESTATLKAWLNEHKKNPYPTKGEKIMLAIITKMTLTQVSTWFANARRRLKKENKMTWEPKNRTDDDDDAMVSDDEKEKEDLEPDKTAHTGSAGMSRTIGMGGGMSVGGGGDRRKDHDKDEDDLTDEEQKPLGHPSDMRSGSLAFPGAASYGGNHPHGYHPYHQHPAYYQHQQAMLAASYHSSNSGGGSGNNVNNNLNNIHKNENNDPKNQLSRDCGVPIPATKPKIWSLADTVACKTPPPIAVAAASFMGQGQQQQDQQQHPHMSGNHNSIQLMQQQQQQQQQPPPHHMTQMQQQHMMSNFAAMPYSRAPTTAYGGFLGATAQQLHTTNNILPYNNISNSSSSHNNSTSTIINHSNSSSSNNSGTNTPTIPITINPLTQQQHHLQQQLHPTTRQTHHHHPAHAAGQRTAMGFPEAQPDTPPQTPPNMKVQSVAANLLFTASQAPTIATCRSSNNSINYGIGSSSHSYAMNYSTRYSEYSPRDESSSGGSSCSSESPTHLQHNEATTFKPLFKSQQQTIAGFVPPV